MKEGRERGVKIVEPAKVDCTSMIPVHHSYFPILRLVQWELSRALCFVLCVSGELVEL